MTEDRRGSREAEYERLERFALGLIEHLGARGYLGGAASAFSEGIVAARGRSLAIRLSGIRQAVGDFLEMTRDFSVEELAAADEYLVGVDLEPLTEVRREFWNEVPKILRRGRIRSRSEYDLLNERLLQGDEYAWSDADRQQAADLVAKYEATRT